MRSRALAPRRLLRCVWLAPGAAKNLTSQYPAPIAIPQGEEHEQRPEPERVKAPSMRLRTRKGTEDPGLGGREVHTGAGGLAAASDLGQAVASCVAAQCAGLQRLESLLVDGAVQS